MKLSKQELAQQFVQRRNKNLDFFQAHYPNLFHHFKGLKMERAEVLISPEEVDLDLKVDGTSWYGGKAAKFGSDEVKTFREIYQPGKKYRTYSPFGSDSFHAGTYLGGFIGKIAEQSPLDKSEFDGYPVGNFLPSVVFLGCGLGFQIEQLLEQVAVVNAVVFEPDQEVFAASLFTVDWTSICGRFNRKRGETIQFAIGKQATEEDLKELLERHLTKSVPIHPYATLFFNHRSQKSMIDLVRRVKDDIHSFVLRWGDYDDDLRRVKNSLYNVRSGHPTMEKSVVDHQDLPVLVVGSGPSIDDRIEDIRAVRDKVILVSAGTGIRALVTSDICPDYHVELDPDVVMHGHLKRLPADLLKQITLLAVQEVNPLVPDLFGKTLFYCKEKSPIAGLFGVSKHTFPRCNPTCTNAALALFYAKGFRQFHLFGCDFGYKDLDKHHSAKSIYGGEESEAATILKKRAQRRFSESSSFKVPSVDGTQILTRGDFFVAKQMVEKLVEQAVMTEKDPPQFFNCSDGAEIQGVGWQDSFSFQASIEAKNSDRDRIEGAKLDLDKGHFELDSSKLSLIAKGLEQHIAKRTKRLSGILTGARVNGGKDLVRCVNTLARENDRIVVGNKFSGASGIEMTSQLLVSSGVRTIMAIGLSHALAVDDAAEQQDFLKVWKSVLQDYLSDLPSHFAESIELLESAGSDPAVTTSLKW